MSLSLVGCRESEKEHQARLAKEKQQEQYIQKLKSYVPADVLTKVPEEFYSDRGSSDHFRIPLTYPYSISVTDTLDNTGFLADARNAKVNDWKEITDERTILYGLTDLAFDGCTLIARIEREAYAAKTATSPSTRWLVFDFATGKEDYFESEGAAIEEAKRRGFAAPIVLEPLKTHYYRTFPNG